MKASWTASAYPGSMVKVVRSQSHEQPSRRSCPRIVPPICSFHFHVSSRKRSRPRSNRVRPRCASRRSMITCTAMLAWSSPGCHIALYPRIRLHRMRQSCRLLLSAWPMWSSPVTLGSGIMMAYGRRAGSGTAWNSPWASHSAYRCASTRAGSYVLGISVTPALLKDRKDRAAKTTPPRLKGRSGAPRYHLCPGGPSEGRPAQALSRALPIGPQARVARAARRSGATFSPYVPGSSHQTLPSLVNDELTPPRPRDRIIAYRVRCAALCVRDRTRSFRRDHARRIPARCAGFRRRHRP